VKKYLLTLLIGTVFLQTIAQKKNESFRLNIKKTTFPVIIDGIANDKAWL